MIPRIINKTEATSGPNQTQLAGNRNKIINGWMAIDQRNVGASQSIGLSSAYTVDRWYASSVGVATTGQQVAGSNGFQYAYQITGAALNTGIVFGQKIESYNAYDLASNTVTLSAYIKASALTSVTWTAYYPTAIDNYTSRTQIATGTFTINSTLTRYSTNISLPSNATNGLQIEFTTGALTSGTITYTGVQLEKGSVATPFENRLYGTELAMCQRYYQAITQGMGYAITASATTVQMQVNLQTTMRTVPTLLFSSAPVITEGSVNITASSAAIANQFSNLTFAGNGLFMQLNNFTGLTANRPYQLNSSSGPFLTASAEL